MYHQVKQRIKKTKQSPAVQSVITQEPVNDALAQIEGLSALGGPPRIDIPPRHTPHKAKKIIIEDFVEVKRLTPSPAPLQGEKGGQPQVLYSDVTLVFYTFSDTVWSILLQLHIMFVLQRTRKRKRKRTHSTTAYPPAPPPPAPAPPSPPPAVVPLVAPHELLRERLDDSHSDSHSSSDRDREDSAEDTTQGDSMDRSAGLEDWTIGEFIYLHSIVVHM